LLILILRYPMCKHPYLFQSTTSTTTIRHVTQSLVSDLFSILAFSSACRSHNWLFSYDSDSKMTPSSSSSNQLKNIVSDFLHENQSHLHHKPKALISVFHLEHNIFSACFAYTKKRTLISITMISFLNSFISFII
jgi:hypothetical protein